MPFVLENSTISASFTSMTQAVMDYPLEEVKVDGHTFQALLGETIILDGDANGDVLQGTFKDGEATGTFELHRVPAEGLPYDTQTVTFRNGDITLAGTACLPRTAGKHPGVVLLHGSGAQSRWGTNRYIADLFARSGIATLVYDKRGSGESTGSWESSTYDDLARDAMVGIDVLRSFSSIDPRKIGLHGHSEGGIVAPVAASLAPQKIAFIVAEDTVAGPVYQQDLYRTRLALQSSGFSSQEIATANRVYALFIDVARGARPRADWTQAVLENQKQAWFQWLGLPGDDSWIWKRYPKIGNIDTLRYWQRVQVPVLLIYGERDHLVPVDESIRRIQAALPHPNSNNSAFIVPNAQHNLTIQPQPKLPFFWWKTAPGLYALIADWVLTTNCQVKL